MGGRISKLSPERHADLVRFTATGSPFWVVADLVSVGERTLVRWRARGEAADEALSAAVAKLGSAARDALDALDDEPRMPVGDNWSAVERARGDDASPRQQALQAMIPARERPFWRLWRDLKRAESLAEASLLQRIREAGDSYETIETIEVVRYDSDGQPTERTVTTKTRRDRAWQANAWILERRWPDRWARTRLTTPNPEDGNGPELGTLEDEQAAAFRAIDELARRRAERDGDSEQ